MISTPGDRAAGVFNQGFNCAQAVFSAYAEQFGLEKETALTLASPFSGGFARRGEICGAVTGALLIQGLRHGADKPARKEDIYRLSQEFMHLSEEKHGDLHCRNLIDCDISTTEGWQKAKASGIFTSECPELVKDAVEIIQALLVPQG